MGNMINVALILDERRKQQKKEKEREQLEQLEQPKKPDIMANFGAPLLEPLLKCHQLE